MDTVSIFATFLEGLLSFLSPCVLPLVPLYMAYLSGESSNTIDGEKKYNQKTVFIRTLFFVLGIFVVFILLAVSIQNIKEYIDDYKNIVTIVGSVFIFIFGLNQLGLIEINVLNKEFSLKNKLNLQTMSILKAFLFGLFFAFAWTPCIGPMLTNAILLSISEEGGVLYLFAYGLGLTLPFVITGIATSFILNILNKFKHVMSIIIKVSGIILICFSIYMLVNSSQNIINSKNSDSYLPKDTYTCADGSKFNFYDYKGKYVAVNFIATWCGYCIDEIPYYTSFSKLKDDFVCIYVMSPVTSNVSEDEIRKFVEEKDITLPVIIDSDSSLTNKYGISSYPTTWFFGPDMSAVGYYSGETNLEGFVNISENVIETFNNK